MCTNTRVRGLFFDIYEGQITAILGRSGAGKSSLLNILNGLSVPTEGSVTIYNKNPSEMQDLEEIQMITGVCPQRNVQFDTLTVKENLRLFAKIKGIQPQEVEQEVQRILLELDIQNIQDSLAVQLSEGQKRKLTLGIAILGDPQILLLDEPTAGLDPFSRHRVWSFLKERKADRVILLSTHFIDEADVLADLFSDLDKGSGQGVMSYDISMSTLNEVFMKLEGKSTTEQVVSTLNKVFFRADGQAMSGLLATMAVDSSVTVSLTEARNIPISPKSRDARPNPEEPVDEDEDVQTERIRTATALTTSIEEVELTGYDSVLDHRGDGRVKFLGYCPQENVLWPTLTAREHLEVFAAVKGLRKADATVTISRLVEAFKLHEQLNVPVQKLMTGATRKLCFVLSILGNPPILLLDEPSTSMDPTEQQQMWQTIQTAIKNTERGALLTTHHMAEAEAICDRVAILVSGRLRFIGSIQHLKNKLGKDYILELKVKETSQAALVHTEILRLFPQAATQERYSSFLTYKLPMEDAHPLSQAFHKLEAVDLGRVDDFNDSNYVIALAPKSKTTQEIMNKVASTPFMKGRTIMGWPDEKSMDELDLNYSTDAVRVIFNDTFLYHLKFLWGDRIPKMKEHRDHSAHCQVMDETITCESSVFWEKGFVAFQAAINAAIVEVSIELKETNCIVNSVLMDVNVTLERRYMKSLMTMMGLQESAFWLSWGLMYSGFTFIMATLMALIVKSAPVVILTGFMVVFTLFLLYGMSLPFCFHCWNGPAEYGCRHSPWFFLKSSFWFQHQRADHAALENETDLDSSTSDPFEPVSPEFHGKEAVRHSSVIMIADAASGSVTIYNHSLSETADPGTISRLTGACPQPSVQFGFLTARENLRLFAQVKGIQPHEVAQEVQRVLRDLEMENIQDILAQHLSGGQKRKLTLGIAFLGDPQVLLLDEPTAGSDPLSRHHVWNLLKERKSDRVILFSTQFMDEADILADLYRDLDRRSNQGIENYGVSVTTLNEVFLKLEGKSGVDEPGSSIDDFIHSLRQQIIALEVDAFGTRSGPDEPSYNGAITVSGDDRALVDVPLFFLILLLMQIVDSIFSPEEVLFIIQSLLVQMLLKGCGGGDALGFLGYCPQENARWPSLTVQEHLEVFAAVKGLRKADAAAAITRLVDALKLQEQLKLPVKALSEGVKRKLCFALSLLGNPSVVLLDEPSTGMDPEGQLRMWQATQATIRNTERGALLTTHYMAEAEAVCDRVAIMVSGRLRCVGSIQHLKSKFGKDYLLEMKVKTLARVESLHGEILRVFLHAARQER
ncbi:hypothetical protein CB1_001336002 [Camelus ferus]|nr:hypothetical protein CB1_001336002 [Camelus ferus]